MRLLRLECIIIIFVSLLTASAGHAQADNVYTREITISELFNEIQAYEGEHYELRNTIIKADSFFFTDTIVIDKNVLISHCKYDHTRLISIENIHFKQNLVIFNVEDFGAFFKNCTFDGFVRWDFSHAPNAVFINCNFFNHFNFFHTSGILQFINCDFSFNSTNKESYYKQLSVFPWNKTLNKLTILNTKFRSETDTSIVSIQGDINNINITGSNFQSQLSLYNCSINQSITVEKTHFELPVAFNKTIIPEIETSFQFDQLSGYKIALMGASNAELYTAMGDEQLADSCLYKFNELISVYSKLFISYKARSDRVSANACYVEMKNIEARRLEYINRNVGGTTAFLNYQLNRFLKFFAAYGTSPVRSIQISIYVILFFAFCYFFVYSEWDRINRKFLISKYSRFQDYLSSPKKLTEMYTEAYSEEYASFQQFKDDLEQHQTKVPFFFSILGKPLFYVSSISHNLRTRLYTKTEILQGKWSDLDSKNKTIKGAIIAVLVITYLTYLGVVRALNSTILSINSFSTLGFGDIPVKGISRYLAILEGFLGWFLLSIFSVSLISQILQG